MNAFSYDVPIQPDDRSPWTLQRLDQLLRHFGAEGGFPAQQEGRFYVVFGGKGSGKTSLLWAIRDKLSERSAIPVAPIEVDLAHYEHAVGSPRAFFATLFEQLREKLDICSIPDEEVKDLYHRKEGATVPDFRRAFRAMMDWGADKIAGRRLMLLLDNADKIVAPDKPWVPDLLSRLAGLFRNPDLKRFITRHLDIVMFGGFTLYDQLIKTDFAERDLRHWMNIETLPEETARQLALTASSLRDQPALVEAIYSQTGGHSLLLQYAVGQLENRHQRGEKITESTVQQIAALLHRPHNDLSKWFRDWYEAIAAQEARDTYLSLMRASEGMTWEQIAEDLRRRKASDPLDLLDPAIVDRSLDALLYHGLIRRVDAGLDFGEGRFAVSGEIFKQWFIRNTLTDEERRDVSVSAQQWAMGILSSAVPILFEVLKWLHEDRLARGKEEPTAPPAKAPLPPDERTEAVTSPPVRDAQGLLTVFQEMDLAAEREAVERVQSLRRQMEKHRRNINRYEEYLADVAVGRERIALENDLQTEREKLQQNAEEMKSVLERLSGRQIGVAGAD
jgi:hypothetical protein